jgi:hypothetical protein
MTTASSFNAALSGRIEINRAVPVPVPGVPEAQGTVFVSEILSRLAAAERTIKRLEREHARMAETDRRGRPKVVKKRQSHPLDRREAPDGLLHTEADADDNFAVRDAGAEDDEFRDVLATASDLARSNA